ncbi:hypothetical protein [Geminicoccus flavidas]|uniref:hypothetical protein n=1 Tax=Geminicoccus flavidas TaxID=2506407 RepID=UPI00135749FA|nr:hypothetical protein [Geminicoccus flavidas]
MVRALNLLLLLLIGLSLGFLTMPAHAMPCLGHDVASDESTASGHFHGSHSRKMTSSAGHAHASMPPSASDQAMPDDLACCHVVVVAAPTVAAALGPSFSMISSKLPRNWLPPRASPGNDIYRPPSSS